MTIEKQFWTYNEYRAFLADLTISPNYEIKNALDLEKIFIPNSWSTKSTEKEKI